MKEISFNQIEEIRKKVLLRSGITIFLFMSYYIGLYYFSYNDRVYTPYLTALNLISLGFVYYGTKVNFHSGSMGFVVTTYVALMIFIYSVGSLRAPGLFWVTALPVVHGILLGRKAVVPSFVITLISILGLHLMEPFRVSEAYIPAEMYQGEKIRNVVIFGVFVFLVVKSFIKIIEDSQAKLAKKNQQVDTLLRMVIHDLGTPLTVLKTYCKKIGKNYKEVDPAIMQKLTASLGAMDELLAHVRVTKALEDGKINIDLENFSLRDSINDCILMFEDKAKEKQIEILLHESEDLNIFANEAIFKGQILSNILSNAIKFSFEKGKIEIKVSAEDGVAMIEVSDKGLGIPDKILANLFDNHFKTSRKGTSGESGTGYGMGIVKSYLNEMNGDLKIETKVKEDGSDDHGTKMIIFIQLSETQIKAA